MNEWRTVPLGEVADILVGYAFKSSMFTPSPDGLRLLRGANVHQGFTSWGQEVRWPSSQTHDPRYELAEGDVVLAMDRPWIEAGLKRARLRDADLPALLVQRVARLRGTREASTSFIHHTLATDTFSRYLQGQVTGATVPHISQSQIASYELMLPSPPLQERICDILDSIDDLIENNRRRGVVLEDMVRAIYREWFVKFRYPGHEDVPMVDSVLGLIPEGWGVRPVRELSVVVVRGISPEYAEDGAWVVLNQKCIRDGRVSLVPSRRQERAVSDVKRIRSGDVLINSTGVGTLGRVAMYRGPSQGVTVDSHVTICRPAEAAFSHWFAMSMLALQAEIERLGTGATGQTELRKSDVELLELIQPVATVALGFAAAVRPMLEQVDALLAYSETLSTLRDQLLPKLVTGQIDVATLDLGEALIVERVA